MGTAPERPDNDAPSNIEDRHFKKRIAKDDIDGTCSIVDMYHPTLGYVATLGWVGVDEESSRIIRQPAVWISGFRENIEDYYISYEGYANYMEGQIAQTHLVVPRNGEVLKMKDNVHYFFNSYDSVTPNLLYRLDANNTSIIMNNISIYNKAHDTGLMINLRASFDGLIDDEDIGGNVNILCSVDTIGVD